MDGKFTQRLNKIEQALTAFFSSSHIADNPKAPKTIDESVEILLRQPCNSLLHGGGKRWRPLLTVLSYELAGGTSDCIYQLCPLVEGIHTASLIHDDIEDSSNFRRGQPAAHISYGIDTALNAGSWLYFQALKSIHDASIPDAVKYSLYQSTLSHIRSLHEGQALDIYWHRNTTLFPSTSAYMTMIEKKTGSLAVLAAYTGMHVANADTTEIQHFSDNILQIGIAFQILDDVKNITTGNTGKKRGDDIVEGKKSLPVILYSEQHPEKKELLAHYFYQAQQEGIQSNAVEKVIELLNNSGAIAAAEERGKKSIDTVLKTWEKCYGSHPAFHALKNLIALMLST